MPTSGIQTVPATWSVILRTSAFALLCMLGWVAIVIATLLVAADPIVARGDDAAALIDAAKRRSADHRGNLAMLVIEDGRVAGSHFMSIGRPVDQNTVFQMASVSKWVTAWGVMTLVQSGKLDLDAPVSRYLTRWQLPPTDYDNDAVTVRRLLSHTAGLTDGLGYCGTAPGSALQPLEESLTHAADACPLTAGSVSVGGPADTWEYSGGGYALLQLLVEEVSGQSFAAYMESAVLRPLGMRHSTYRPGAGGLQNLAEFFDGDGGPALHYRYTVAAAGSLYTSASDLALFANAHVRGADGSLAGRGVLTPATLAMMRAPQARVVGRPHWGLGMRLYAPRRGGGHIIGHDGGNFPAVNTTVRLDPVSGDAIIALSTGGNGIASKLGSAWLRQRVDAADLPDEGANPFALLAQAWGARRWIFGGAIIILFGAVAHIIRRLGRRRALRGSPPAV